MQFKIQVKNMEDNQKYPKVINELGMDNQKSLSGGDFAQSAKMTLIGDFTTYVNLEGTNNSPVDILHTISMIGLKKLILINLLPPLNKINDIGEN